MLEAMMSYLWGPRVSKIQKDITFDDDDWDMIPEFKETKKEIEDTRKKMHPLIAQLKDRELKWSKMEKLSKTLGHSAGKRLEAKVLVCLDDSPNSVMLLDLCQKYLEEVPQLTFKKRPFQMLDLVVSHISRSGQTFPNAINLSIDDELLKSDWKSATSKEDVEQILKFRKFADLAIANECSALVFPDTCTEIAIRSISDIALGKGLALSHNIAPFITITHKDHQLLILRPLYEITEEDVKHYNDIMGLDSTQIGETNVDSIQNATRNFLLQLQKEHPSTINIVTKTCLKLDRQTGDGLCLFCQGPRLDSDVLWRQNHNLVNSSSTGLSSHQGQDLSICYACQNIMMDVDNDDGIDNASFIGMISSD